MLLIAPRAGLRPTRPPRGGKAVFVETADGREVITWFDGTRRQPLLEVAAIPATYQGRARHNVCNAVAAMDASTSFPAYPSG